MQLKDILTLLVAATGISVATGQFIWNSFVGRSIKASDEIQALNNDDDIRVILDLFDYGHGYVIIEHPEKAHVYVDATTLRSSLMNHEKKRAIMARTELVDKHAEFSSQPLFNDIEREVRRCLDVLLLRLERMEFLIDRKVISKSDFRQSFSYWLENLAERPHHDDTSIHFGNGKRREFWRYIRFYRYTGVIRLFQRFDRAAGEELAPEDAFEVRPATALGSVQKTVL